MKTNLQAYNDGIGGGSAHKILIDLTSQLRQKLGRMVRQGSVVYVDSISIAISPENSPLGGEDEMGGVAAGGQLNWFCPTKPRVAAWKEAFYHVQEQRKNSGAMPVRGYDFRVGYTDIYDTVTQQAWSEKDDRPLYLLDTSYEAGEFAQGVFNAFNAKKLNLGGSPIGQEQVTKESMFGTPYEIADSSSAADPDHMINDDTELFVPGSASPLMDTVPWNSTFVGQFAETADDVPSNAILFHHKFDRPAKVMCGLMALDLLYTTIDDTLDNEEYTLYWSVEVRNYAPLLRRQRLRGNPVKSKNWKR